MIGSCYIGDARDGLRAMIAAGVRAQTCCTSPPYWGLRDYGTAEWEGGDVKCDHIGPPMRTNNKPSNSAAAFHGGLTRGAEPWPDRNCGKCGATRIDKQLGLEPTIAEYVANMVEVFRLVRDVLADDGTLWLNMGDSYCNTDKWGGLSGGKNAPASTGNEGNRRRRQGIHERVLTKEERERLTTGLDYLPGPLKPKDLCGIPWRVAFALQADGWYLRQDIIWSKPNPMPESVTDRCTKSHEYLFLLSKRERYYYDAEAISEPAINAGRVGYDGTQKNCETIGDPLFATRITSDRTVGDSRNRRSVWTVTTQPYSEAHFATFPPKLIEPCILAGSRVGDVVLDPFMGSGTVGQVSQDLGRRWIGCELSSDYAKLIQQRTQQQGLELSA